MVTGIVADNFFNRQFIFFKERIVDQINYRIWRSTTEKTIDIKVEAAITLP